MSMQHNLDGNIILENDIEFSTQDIAVTMSMNPATMRILALAIRNMQTKQVRRMGNLYGKNAQQTKHQPPTKMRLT